MRGLAQFWRRPLNVLGTLLVAGFVGAAVLAPLLSGPVFDPGQPSLSFKVVGDPQDDTPRPPRPGAPLGTTPGQLDVYHTLVWGTRSALLFGGGVALAAAVLGTLVGAISGYAGGWVQLVLMRLTDALMSIPVLAGVWLFELLILPPAIQATQDLFGWDPSIFQQVAFDFELSPLLIGLVLFSWMPYARLINGSVRVLKQAEFITAARAVGMRPWDILRRHLIPNAIAPSLVMFARDIGSMVVLGAAFTFIGIRGGSEWGTLLVVSRAWILGAPGNPLKYWWAYVPVTAALVLFSAGWNLLGDGLNGWINPQDKDA